MTNKLILATAEAQSLAGYLAGFTESIEGGGVVYLGLGTITGTSFTEITPNEANNYARVLVKRSYDAYPDLLTLSGRTVHNHEQIVFNKVLSEAYTAPAVGFFRQEAGGSPYAYGNLQAELSAAVGSLPVFLRNELQFTVPDGTEAE